MLKRFPQQIVSPKTGRNFHVFWAGDPVKVNLKAPNPEKARVRNRTRRLNYKAIKRANRLNIATCRRDEETEKNI